MNCLELRQNAGKSIVSKRKTWLITSHAVKRESILCETLSARWGRSKSSGIWRRVVGYFPTFQGIAVLLPSGSSSFMKTAVRECIVLYCMVWYHIISYYIISYHIILYYIILYYIILYYIILYYIILYYIILYYIILYFSFVGWTL